MLLERIEISILLFLLCLPIHATAELNIPAFDSGNITILSKIGSAEIREASGLARSHNFPKVIWVHNDSSDKHKKEARIFPIFEDGRVIRNKGIRVKKARNYDWEAITLDDRGNLIIGDFGNNCYCRQNFEKRGLALYMVKEPDPYKSNAKKSEKSFKIPFSYPDQKEERGFNAEAMFYTNKTVYILTKYYGYKDKKKRKIETNSSYGETQLYRFNTLEPNKKNHLTFIGKFLTGGLITDADISEDGKILAVLTYNYVLLFYSKNPENEDWLNGKVKALRLIPLSKEDDWKAKDWETRKEKPQYEGICFINDNKELLIASESIYNKKKKIYSNKAMIKVSVNDFLEGI